MSALDDFIAQDPEGRDFVDLHGFTWWNEDAVRTQTEWILQGIYSIEQQRIFGRKTDIYTLQRQAQIAAVAGLSPDPDMPLPPYSLSTQEKQELATYGGVVLLCGALKDLMWGRAQLVNACLGVEPLRDALDAVPPLPEDPQATDDYAVLRASRQAAYDAAYSALTADQKALLADRYAYFHPEQP